MPTKTITMVVSIRVPQWLSAKNARREIRSLISDQCFYGHANPNDRLNEIDTDDLRLVSVKHHRAT